MFFEDDLNTLTTYGIPTTPGTTFFTSTGSTITDIDICFNAFSYGWTQYSNGVQSSPDSVALLQRIATHEIGHLLSLAHYGSNDDIMYAADPFETTVEIGSDDELGASFLYGGIINKDYHNSDDTDIYFDWDITVDDGITLTIGLSTQSNTAYVADSKEINVNGTLRVRSDGDYNFTRKSGSSSYWSGIDINSGGTLDIPNDRVAIEYAVHGIDIYGTGTITVSADSININNCQNTGINISNCSPEIEKVRITGTSSGYGGLNVEGSSSDPVLHDITITDCVKGIQLGNYTDAGVYLCDIRSITYQCINMGAAVGLTMDGHDGYGYNTIDPAASQKAIDNTSDCDSIGAQYNYWGGTPTDSIFGYPSEVDYTNYLGSADADVGVGKKAFYTLNPFVEAGQYERQGSLDEAYSLYRSIFTNTGKIQDKRRAIKSMLRVADKSRKGYSEIRTIIENELLDNETTGDYRAVLDYIFCELNIREGNIERALEGYNFKAKDYNGTAMEVEMLARIAEIYGNMLDDKVKAKEFADMAASLNPGQMILGSAYNAASIEYNPEQYEDVFELGKKTGDKAKDAEETADIAGFVTVTPNPANPMTTITYAIANPSRVKLDIYNISGQKVSTLVDAPMSAGTHAATFDGSGLASGVYFYRLESKGFRKSGKMLLVK
jgi:hypothetical protein